MGLLQRVRGRVAAIMGVALAGLLAWAFLWPNPLCTTPDCAEPRYRLFIELDSLGGAEPVPLEVTDGDQVHSVAGLFADGGVILDIVRDDSRLPYDDSAGPLDQADLLAYFQAWSSLPRPPGADAKVYALATPTLRSDSGQLVFGMLFDLGAREGVAVAPGVVRRLFRRHNEAQVPLLQMRTFAHELLHALNRYHADGAVSRDGRLTVEAPTNCLALVSPGEWRLTEDPLWALSPSTIGFFQSADPRLVLPGAGGSPFEFRRDSVRDCELARRNPLEPDHPRLTLALERLLGFLPEARAQQAADSAGTEAADSAADATADPMRARLEPIAGETRLHLRLEGHAAPWLLGYPAVVRVHARNEGDVALPLVNRLAPAYGNLVLEVRPVNAEQADAETWRPVHPLVTLETISDERSLLMPGEATSQSIEVYFGQGGDQDAWTFPKPGDYELRARAILGEDREIAHSEPLPVTVVAPTATEDVAALALVLKPASDETSDEASDEANDQDGRLDPAVGRFLSFRGRIPDADVRGRVARVVSTHPDTALAAAFRFTLGAALLRPPIDPATGRRAGADTAAARRLINESCRDAGIVALARRSWLNNTDPVAAQDPAILAALEAEAWEGRARDEDGLAYGDPGLVAAAPPVTFGLGTSALWDRGERELRRIGRRLAREGVTRVLVAGHADGTGTCAVNDALALARARAVAGALQRGGLPRRAITVVGLGARRPLDFATTPAADARNRRVEILVPAEPFPAS